MLAMRSSHDRPFDKLGRALATALTTAALAVPAVLMALPAAAQAYGQGTDSYADQAGYDSGYSYVRNLRGSATLIQGDTGDRQAAEINQPVLVGDRLWVAPGSMLEVLLSDGNLLRVDGDSEVLFARLAGSPETRDEATELVLVEGNVQLVVFADAAGRELPRVELPNGTVYVEEAGAYRLTAGRGWSQVLARSGWAEVATDRGSVVVRSGEEAVLDGSRGGGTVRTAAFRDDLERWADRLDRQVAEVAHVDRSLRHAAASLDGHGTWIDDGGRHVWRPRVGADWRPYWHGRWRHTPLGLTWVSSEPWGWAPYHYGTWDLHPRWGWVWYPGTAFAPAWVYWYWGPSHVAWVPAGYYTHHYRGRHHYPGFRFGTYGWAGGHWGIFSDWVFCPTGYFGRPHQNRHHWRGRDWNRHHDGPVPRGVIAIDTRPLGRDDLHDGERAMRALRSRPTSGGGVAARAGGELPDVTDFVARKRELPDEVTRRVFVDPQDGARVRVAGTPLAPDASEAARPRAAVPRSGVIDSGGRGGAGRVDGARGGDGAAPRARVSPRVPNVDAPGDGQGAEASPGVGRVRPRSVEPDTGGDRDSGSPATGARPRTIAPRQDDGGAGASPPAVRPRQIAPREPAGSAPGVAAAPRRIEPRRIEPRQEGARPEATPPAGAAAPTPRSAVRPRTIEPRRPAGDVERPAATQGSRPGVRRQDSGGGDGDGGGGRALRSTAPRTVTPDAYARSPRARAPSSERPSVVVPPRSERRGVESAPPARRVVGGVRSEAPSRPSVRPPAATPRSTPSRPPAAKTPATSSPRSGSPARTRAASPRSDDGPSGSSSSASSGSGSSAKPSASSRSGSSSRSSKGSGRGRAGRRGGGG